MRSEGKQEIRLPEAGAYRALGHRTALVAGQCSEHPGSHCRLQSRTFSPSGNPEWELPWRRRGRAYLSVDPEADGNSPLKLHAVHNVRPRRLVRQWALLLPESLLPKTGESVREAAVQ